MKIKNTFYFILLFLLISLKGMAHSKPCSYASSLCAPKPWTSPTVCGCSTSANIPANDCHINPTGHKLAICQPSQWYYCDADVWIQKKGHNELICQN